MIKDVNRFNPKDVIYVALSCSDSEFLALTSINLTFRRLSPKSVEAFI
jgi:hypothetical protein